MFSACLSENYLYFFASSVSLCEIVTLNIYTGGVG